ncbi:hypothetical protein BW897_16790 [Bacillus cereus]|uniref:Uncharacterized protein n=1 Tax=Bacillus cereus TaxID=1396 RepID=A0A1S9TNH0_BACCE|nr:hypothetical protein [Bacillus cereus]OOR11574.1 hypothetical protein BW897_16790 [Bacillus cereus]
MMIIIFLLTGWILSWFKFDKLFIQAFKELFNKEITIASYYFMFFLYWCTWRLDFIFQWRLYNSFSQLKGAIFEETLDF